jgi:hypothetical protein
VAASPTSSIISRRSRSRLKFSSYSVAWASSGIDSQRIGLDEPGTEYSQRGEDVVLEILAELSGGVFAFDPDAIEEGLAARAAKGRRPQEHVKVLELLQVPRFEQLDQIDLVVSTGPVLFVPYNRQVRPFVRIPQLRSSGVRSR